MGDYIKFPVKDLAGTYNIQPQKTMVLLTKPELIHTTADKQFTWAPVEIWSSEQAGPKHYFYPEDGIVFCKGTVMGASPTFVHIYELHVTEIDGSIVMMHGHEELIRFDVNDVAGTIKISYIG